MNRCARNVSEMASAIEKCISYLLSTYKYIISRVAKLISDTFLHSGGALKIHIVHIPGAVGKFRENILFRENIPQVNILPFFFEEHQSGCLVDK